MGSFDHIDHNHLLATIGPVPGRALITQWLKAGYVDKDVFFETKEGTPQGGIASPLLANIALHGMEQALGITYDDRGHNTSTRAMVRYADDFVVFCKSREDAETVIGDLTSWLAQWGLTLSSEKTRIVHLTEGFDFLGYTVRHYNSSRTRSGRKLLITPSKAAVKKIRDTLRAEWCRLKGAPTAAIMQKLNPIIRGWALYYRTVVSSRTFASLDYWMYLRANQWAKIRHPGKSKAWRQHRYWGALNPRRQDAWVFGDKETGAYLLKFSWHTHRKHVMVKGTASPDNPDLRDYWRKRADGKRRA